jgi:hypothetical protein
MMKSEIDLLFDCLLCRCSNSSIKFQLYSTQSLIEDQFFEWYFSYYDITVFESIRNSVLLIFWLLTCIYWSFVASYSKKDVLVTILKSRMWLCMLNHRTDIKDRDHEIWRIRCSIFVNLNIRQSFNLSLSVHLFYGDGTGPCSTSSEHALNTIVVGWSDTIF